MMNNYGDPNRTHNGPEAPSSQAPPPPYPPHPPHPPQPTPNVSGPAIHPPMPVLPPRNYSTPAQLDEYFNNCIYQSKIFPGQRNPSQSYKRNINHEYPTDKRPYLCYKTCCQPHPSSYSMNATATPTPIQFPPFSHLNQQSSPLDSSLSDQMIHGQSLSQQCQQMDLRYLQSHQGPNPMFSQRVGSRVNSREPQSALGSHYSSSNYFHHPFYNTRPNFPISPDYFDRMPNRNQSSKANALKHQTSVIKNSNDFSYPSEGSQKSPSMMPMTPVNYMYNKRHAAEPFCASYLPACSQPSCPPTNQYSSTVTPHSPRTPVIETTNSYPPFNSFSTVPVAPVASVAPVAPIGTSSPKQTPPEETLKKDSSSKPPLNIDVRQFLATWDDDDDEPAQPSSAPQVLSPVCNAMKQSSQSRGDASFSDVRDNVATVNPTRSEYSVLSSGEDSRVLFKILKPTPEKGGLNDDNDVYSGNMEPYTYNQPQLSPSNSPAGTHSSANPVHHEPYPKPGSTISGLQYQSEAIASYYRNKSKCNKSDFSLERISSDNMSPSDDRRSSPCHYPVLSDQNQVKTHGSSSQAASPKATYLNLDHNLGRNSELYSPISRASKTLSKTTRPLTPAPPQYDFRDPEAYIKSTVINKCDYVRKTKTDNESVFKRAPNSRDSKRGGRTANSKERNVSIVPPNIQYNDKVATSTNSVSYHESLPQYHRGQMPYNKTTLMPYCIPDNNQLTNPNYDYSVNSVVGVMNNSHNYVKYDPNPPKYPSEEQKYDNTCSVNINLSITSDKSPQVFLNSVSAPASNQISCSKSIDNSMLLHEGSNQMEYFNDNVDALRKSKKSVNMHKVENVPTRSTACINENSLSNSPAAKCNQETKSSNYPSRTSEMFHIQSLISDQKANIPNSTPPSNIYLGSSDLRKTDFSAPTLNSQNVSTIKRPNSCVGWSKSVNNSKLNETSMHEPTSNLNQVFVPLERPSSCPTNSTMFHYENTSSGAISGPFNQAGLFDSSSFPVRDKNQGNESSTSFLTSGMNSSNFESTAHKVSCLETEHRGNLVTDVRNDARSVSCESKVLESFESQYHEPIHSNSESTRNISVELSPPRKTARVSPDSLMVKSDSLDINSNSIDSETKIDCGSQITATSALSVKFHDSPSRENQGKPSGDGRNSTAIIDHNMNVDSPNNISNDDSTSLQNNSVITSTFTHKLDTDANPNEKATESLDDESGRVDSVTVESTEIIPSNSDPIEERKSDHHPLSRIDGENSKQELIGSNNGDAIDSIINKTCDSLKDPDNDLLSSPLRFPAESRQEKKEDSAVDNRISPLSFLDFGTGSNTSNEKGEKPASSTSSSSKDTAAVTIEKFESSSCSKTTKIVSGMADLLGSDNSDCDDVGVDKGDSRKNLMTAPKMRSVSSDYSNFDLFHDSPSFFTHALPCSEPSQRKANCSSPPSKTAMQASCGYSYAGSANMNDCFGLNTTAAESSQSVGRAKNDELALSKSDNHTDFELLVQNEMNKFNFESDILNISSLEEVEVEASQFFNEQSLTHNSEKLLVSSETGQRENLNNRRWSQTEENAKSNSDSRSQVVSENSTLAQPLTENKDFLSSMKKAKKSAKTIWKGRNFQVEHISATNGISSFFTDSDEKTETSSENEEVSNFLTAPEIKTTSATTQVNNFISSCSRSNCANVETLTGKGEAVIRERTGYISRTKLRTPAAAKAYDDIQVPGRETELEQESNGNFANLKLVSSGTELLEITPRLTARRESEDTVGGKSTSCYRMDFDSRVKSELSATSSDVCESFSNQMKKSFDEAVGSNPSKFQDCSPKVSISLRKIRKKKKRGPKPDVTNSLPSEQRLSDDVILEVSDHTNSLLVSHEQRSENQGSINVLTGNHSNRMTNTTHQTDDEEALKSPKTFTVPSSTKNVKINVSSSSNESASLVGLQSALCSDSHYEEECPKSPQAPLIEDDRPATPVSLSQSPSNSPVTFSHENQRRSSFQDGNQQNDNYCNKESIASKDCKDRYSQNEDELFHLLSPAFSDNIETSTEVIQNDVTESPRKLLRSNDPFMFHDEDSVRNSRTLASDGKNESNTFLDPDSSENDGRLAVYEHFKADNVENNPSPVMNDIAYESSDSAIPHNQTEPQGTQSDDHLDQEMENCLKEVISIRTRINNPPENLDEGGEIIKETESVSLAPMFQFIPKETCSDHPVADEGAASQKIPTKVIDTKTMSDFSIIDDCSEFERNLSEEYSDEGCSALSNVVEDICSKSNPCLIENLSSNNSLSSSPQFLKGTVCEISVTESNVEEMLECGGTNREDQTQRDAKSDSETKNSTNNANFFSVGDSVGEFERQNSSQFMLSDSATPRGSVSNIESSSSYFTNSQNTDTSFTTVSGKKEKKKKKKKRRYESTHNIWEGFDSTLNPEPDACLISDSTLHHIDESVAELKPEDPSQFFLSSSAQGTPSLSNISTSSNSVNPQSSAIIYEPAVEPKKKKKKKKKKRSSISIFSEPDVMDNSEVNLISINNTNLPSVESIDGLKPQDTPQCLLTNSSQNEPVFDNCSTASEFINPQSSNMFQDNPVSTNSSTSDPTNPASSILFQNDAISSNVCPSDGIDPQSSNMCQNNPVSTNSSASDSANPASSNFFQNDPVSTNIYSSSDCIDTQSSKNIQKDPSSMNFYSSLDLVSLESSNQKYEPVVEPKKKKKKKKKSKEPNFFFQVIDSMLMKKKSHPTTNSGEALVLNAGSMQNFNEFDKPVVISSSHSPNAPIDGIKIKVETSSSVHAEPSKFFSHEPYTEEKQKLSSISGEDSKIDVVNIKAKSVVDKLIFISSEINSGFDEGNSSVNTAKEVERNDGDETVIFADKSPTSKTVEVESNFAATLNEKRPPVDASYLKQTKSYCDYKSPVFSTDINTHSNEQVGVEEDIMCENTGITIKLESSVISGTPKAGKEASDSAPWSQFAGSAIGNVFEREEREREMEHISLPNDGLITIDNFESDVNGSKIKNCQKAENDCSTPVEKKMKLYRNEVTEDRMVGIAEGTNFFPDLSDPLKSKDLTDIAILEPGVESEVCTRSPPSNSEYERKAGSKCEIDVRKQPSSNKKHTSSSKQDLEKTDGKNKNEEQNELRQWYNSLKSRKTGTFTSSEGTKGWESAEVSKKASQTDIIDPVKKINAKKDNQKFESSVSEVREPNPSTTSTATKDRRSSHKRGDIEARQETTRTKHDSRKEDRNPKRRRDYSDAHRRSPHYREHSSRRDGDSRNFGRHASIDTKRDSTFDKRSPTLGVRKDKRNETFTSSAKYETKLPIIPSEAKWRASVESQERKSDKVRDENYFGSKKRSKNPSENNVSSPATPKTFLLDHASEESSQKRYEPKKSPKEGEKNPSEIMMSPPATPEAFLHDHIPEESSQKRYEPKKSPKEGAENPSENNLSSSATPNAFLLEQVLDKSSQKRYEPRKPSEEHQENPSGNMSSPATPEALIPDHILKESCQKRYKQGQFPEDCSKSTSENKIVSSVDPKDFVPNDGLEESSQQKHEPKRSKSNQSCTTNSDIIAQNVSSNFDIFTDYDGRQETMNFDNFHILFEKTWEKFAKFKEMSKMKTNLNGQSLSKSSTEVKLDSQNSVKSPKFDQSDAHIDSVDEKSQSTLRASGSSNSTNFKIKINRSEKRDCVRSEETFSSSSTTTDKKKEGSNSEVTDNLKLLQNVFGTNKTRYKLSNAHYSNNVPDLIPKPSCKPSALPPSIDRSLYFAENYRIIDVSKIPLPPSDPQSAGNPQRSLGSIYVDDPNAVNCKLFPSAASGVCKRINEAAVASNLQGSSSSSTIKCPSQMTPQQQELKTLPPFLNSTPNSKLKEKNIRYSNYYQKLMHKKLHGKGRTSIEREKSSDSCSSMKVVFASKSQPSEPKEQKLNSDVGCNKPLSVGKSVISEQMELEESSGASVNNRIDKNSPSSISTKPKERKSLNTTLIESGISIPCPKEKISKLDQTNSRNLCGISSNISVLTKVTKSDNKVTSSDTCSDSSNFPPPELSWNIYEAEEKKTKTSHQDSNVVSPSSNSKIHTSERSFSKLSAEQAKLISPSSKLKSLESTKKAAMISVVDSGKATEMKSSGIKFEGTALHGPRPTESEKVAAPLEICERVLTASDSDGKLSKFSSHDSERASCFSVEKSKLEQKNAEIPSSASITRILERDALKSNVANSEPSLVSCRRKKDHTGRCKVTAPLVENEGVSSPSKSKISDSEGSSRQSPFSKAEGISLTSSGNESNAGSKKAHIFIDELETSKSVDESLLVSAKESDPEVQTTKVSRDELAKASTPSNLKVSHSIKGSSKSTSSKSQMASLSTNAKSFKQEGEEDKIPLTVHEEATLASKNKTSDSLRVSNSTSSKAKVASSTSKRKEFERSGERGKISHFEHEKTSSSKLKESDSNKNLSKSRTCDSNRDSSKSSVRKSEVAPPPSLKTKKPDLVELERSSSPPSKRKISNSHLDVSNFSSNHSKLASSSTKMKELEVEGTEVKSPNVPSEKTPPPSKFQASDSMEDSWKSTPDKSESATSFSNMNESEIERKKVHASTVGHEKGHSISRLKASDSNGHSLKSKVHAPTAGHEEGSSMSKLKAVDSSGHSSKSEVHAPTVGHEEESSLSKLKALDSYEHSSKPTPSKSETAPSSSKRKELEAESERVKASLAERERAPSLSKFECKEASSSSKFERERASSLSKSIPSESSSEAELALPSLRRKEIESVRDQKEFPKVTSTGADLPSKLKQVKTLHAELESSPLPPTSKAFDSNGDSMEQSARSKSAVSLVSSKMMESTTETSKTMIPCIEFEQSSSCMSNSNSIEFASKSTSSECRVPRSLSTMKESKSKVSNLNRDSSKSRRSESEMISSQTTSSNSDSMKVASKSTSSDSIVPQPSLITKKSKSKLPNLSRDSSKYFRRESEMVSSKTISSGEEKKEAKVLHVELKKTISSSKLKSSSSNGGSSKLTLSKSEVTSPSSKTKESEAERKKVKMPLIELKSSPPPVMNAATSKSIPCKSEVASPPSELKKSKLEKRNAKILHDEDKGVASSSKSVTFSSVGNNLKSTDCKSEVVLSPSCTKPFDIDERKTKITDDGHKLVSNSSKVEACNASCDESKPENKSQVGSPAAKSKSAESDLSKSSQKSKTLPQEGEARTLILQKFDDVRSSQKLKTKGPKKRNDFADNIKRKDKVSSPSDLRIPNGPQLESDFLCDESERVSSPRKSRKIAIGKGESQALRSQSRTFNESSAKSDTPARNVGKLNIKHLEIASVELLSSCVDSNQSNSHGSEEFKRSSLEFDEISQTIGKTLDQSGKTSVNIFKGTLGLLNSGKAQRSPLKSLTLDSNDSIALKKNKSINNCEERIVFSQGRSIGKNVDNSMMSHQSIKPSKLSCEITDCIISNKAFYPEGAQPSNLGSEGSDGQSVKTGHQITDCTLSNVEANSSDSLLFDTSREPADCFIPIKATSSSCSQPSEMNDTLTDHIIINEAASLKVLQLSTMSSEVTDYIISRSRISCSNAPSLPEAAVSQNETLSDSSTVKTTQLSTEKYFKSTGKKLDYSSQNDVPSALQLSFISSMDESGTGGETSGKNINSSTLLTSNNSSNQITNLCASKPSNTDTALTSLNPPVLVDEALQAKDATTSMFHRISKKDLSAKLSKCKDLDLGDTQLCIEQSPSVSDEKLTKKKTSIDTAPGIKFPSQENSKSGRAHQACESKVDERLTKVQSSNFELRKELPQEENICLITSPKEEATTAFTNPSIVQTTGRDRCDQEKKVSSPSDGFDQHSPSVEINVAIHEQSLNEAPTKESKERTLQCEKRTLAEDVSYPSSSKRTRRSTKDSSKLDECHEGKLEAPRKRRIDKNSSDPKIISPKKNKRGSESKTWNHKERESSSSERGAEGTERIFFRKDRTGRKKSSSLVSSSRLDAGPPKSCALDCPPRKSDLTLDVVNLSQEYNDRKKTNFSNDNFNITVDGKELKRNFTNNPLTGGPHSIVKLSPDESPARKLSSNQISKKSSKKCKSVYQLSNKKNNKKDVSGKSSKSVNNLRSKSNSESSTSPTYLKGFELDGSDSFVKCFSFLKDNMRYISDPSSCSLINSENEIDVHSDVREEITDTGLENGTLLSSVKEDELFYENLETELYNSELNYLNNYSNDNAFDFGNRDHSFPDFNPELDVVDLETDDSNLEKQAPASSQNSDSNDLKVRLPWNRIFNLKRRRKKNLSNTKGIELGPAKIEVRLNSNENSGSWKVIKNRSLSVSSDDNCSMSSPIGIKVNRLVLQRHPIINDSKNKSTSGISDVDHAPQLTAATGEKPEIIPNVVIKKNGSKFYKSYITFSNKPQPVVKLVRDKYLDQLALQWKAHKSEMKRRSKNKSGMSTHHHVPEKDEKCLKSCMDAVSITDCTLSQSSPAVSNQNESLETSLEFTRKRRRSSKGCQGLPSVADDTVTREASDFGASSVTRRKSVDLKKKNETDRKNSHLTSRKISGEIKISNDSERKKISDDSGREEIEDGSVEKKSCHESDKSKVLNDSDRRKSHKSSDQKKINSDSLRKKIGDADPEKISDVSSKKNDQTSSKNCRDTDRKKRSHTFHKKTGIASIKKVNDSDSDQHFREKEEPNCGICAEFCDTIPADTTAVQACKDSCGNSEETSAESIIDTKSSSLPVHQDDTTNFEIEDVSHQSAVKKRTQTHPDKKTNFEKMADKAPATTSSAPRVKRSASLDSEENFQYKRFRRDCGICSSEMAGRIDVNSNLMDEKYHCTQCCLEFESKEKEDIHFSTFHKDLTETWNCLLCQRKFRSQTLFDMHLNGRTHQLIETIQRETIHSLFSHFTGKDCPLLEPVGGESKLLPTSSDFKIGSAESHCTPLEIALQGKVINPKMTKN